MEKKITNKNAIIKRSNNIAPARSGSSSVVKSVKSEKVTVIEHRKKSKTPLPLGIIFTICAVTLLFVFLVMNYAEVDSYNAQIAELRDELTELQKTASKLKVRLEKKNDLVEIEEYATDELGMVKAAGLTRINITALPENGGDTYKYDDGDENGIGVLLAGFGEVFRDFFD
ncbi:MAG: septum formation initiator family protein [Clostridia bacterium]|nr:septum formation initiator family protein [Clostridia bacterium]